MIKCQQWHVSQPERWQEQKNVFSPCHHIRVICLRLGIQVLKQTKNGLGLGVCTWQFALQTMAPIVPQNQRFHVGGLGFVKLL